MQPDRAHRLLNTILLVFAIALIGLREPADDLATSIVAVAVAGGMLVATFLMIRIAARNQDEIREYLGLSVGGGA